MLHSFNLRDLSRVYEGLCLATADVTRESSTFLRLWRNECDRVFCDRLTTTDDQNSYHCKIKEIISTNFPTVYDVVMRQPLLFGDMKYAAQRLQSEGAAEDPKLYQDLGQYKDIRTIFQSVLGMLYC